MGFTYDKQTSYLKPEYLDPKTKQINVNSYLQVKSDNVVLSNIFSIGDVCKTPSDEEKAILPIHVMTSTLARNLVNLILNKHIDHFESIPDTLHRVYLINLGTRGHGMIIFNDFVLKANPKIPLYDI